MFEWYFFINNHASDLNFQYFLNDLKIILHHFIQNRRRILILRVNSRL